MKTHPTQQEILLLINTGFSSKEWYKKDSLENTHLTEEEQLEEACWNGLFQETFTEICGLPAGNKKLYIWNIEKAASFIELDLSEYPTSKDKFFSLNPYSFLEMKCYN